MATRVVTARTEIFWENVEPTGFCWNWTGYQRDYARGYGSFWFEGRLVMAHRLAYEYLVGSVESSLDIDHLCRNPNCVNPDHLEPVSRAVNNARSFNVSGTNSRKARCKFGHLFTEGNIYPLKDGGRSCRKCRQKISREASAVRRREGTGTPCIIENCAAFGYARGLCRGHYKKAIYRGRLEEVALPSKREGRSAA